MTWAGHWRARRLEPLIAAQARFYEAPRELDAIECEQLARLNAAWATMLERSPWAMALARRFDLPPRFASWPDLARRLPRLDKADLRALPVDAAALPSHRVTHRATGGTTAEPMRFPVFPEEARTASLDAWLGRRWFGIAPADRLFLIWGHSHLLGFGLKGWWAGRRRHLADRALGYMRHSAYDLGDDSLRRAGHDLLRFRPRYLLGYATALDRFAHANLDRRGEMRALGLKAVIATAESFPAANSRSLLAALFDCPVVMEYGAVETGVVAYERPAGGYAVFWAHHRVDWVESPAFPGARELLVTSLYPRALPLLRYAVGDLAMADARADAPLLSFDRVVGRCNDSVPLPDGRQIHSEAVTHAVRDCARIRAFQVVLGAVDDTPLLRYEADEPLSRDDASKVAARLARIEPGLASMPLEWTSHIPRTVAGKQRMVIRERPE